MSVDRAKYKRRSMDELESVAIVVLGDQWSNRGIGCGLLGEGMFADQPGAYLGSAPYARIAGKVVKRLESKGEATYRYDGGWRLTTKGLKRLDAERSP